MKVRVAVPGSCGELVQGTYNGSPCLVSCPIDKSAEIELEVFPGRGRVTAPRSMPKTRRAVRQALARLDRKDADVKIQRLRGLPEAKGYASSTADILAALFGLGKALGITMPADLATRLALDVEPTDSLAWPGLNLLSYRDGTLMAPLGRTPDLYVLILDWGGTVDTLTYNRRPGQCLLQKLETLHREAFELLKEGAALNDVELIGKAATFSASAHQQLLYKPQLDTVIKLAENVAAPGVCVAHSGTLIGVLLKPDQAEDSQAGGPVEAILSHLPDKPEHSLLALVNGGPRFTEERINCPIP